MELIVSLEQELLEAELILKKIFLKKVTFFTIKKVKTFTDDQEGNPLDCIKSQA